MPAFDPNQLPATSRPPSERTRDRKKLDPERYVEAIPAAKVRGGLIQIAPNRRPGLQWAEGLTGVIVTNLRGGSFRVHLNDESGKLRAARVTVNDLASWP